MASQPGRRDDRWPEFTVAQLGTENAYHYHRNTCVSLGHPNRAKQTQFSAGRMTLNKSPKNTYDCSWVMETLQIKPNSLSRSAHGSPEQQDSEGR